MGLVNRFVPDDALQTETLKLAERLAAGPAAAYRYMKRNLNAAARMSLPEVIELETQHMIRCGQTEDAKVLVKAMQEGREPVFRGY
jgi:2-(1,2-epoxy-1,2-dihydrophenyl)acetyl-CoA isomerase